MKVRLVIPNGRSTSTPGQRRRKITYETTESCHRPNVDVAGIMSLPGSSSQKICFPDAKLFPPLLRTDMAACIPWLMPMSLWKASKGMSIVAMEPEEQYRYGFYIQPRTTHSRDMRAIPHHSLHAIPPQLKDQYTKSLQQRGSIVD